MPISYKVIGRHIRDARKSAGLTQEAAANQLGLSLEHYGKVERGDRSQRQKLNTLDARSS